LRILLAGMSNMLTSIITGAISQMPDVVVAGHVARQEDVPSEIHLNAVDAIIVQTREPGDGAFQTAAAPIPRAEDHRDQFDRR